MTDRELWLTKAAEIINREIIQSKGASLPEKWKISVGFPHGHFRAIGQAWGCENSSDGETHHVFISPVLGVEDKVNFMQVILHELLHITVGIDQKHGGEFKRLAREIGLEGKLTATYVSEGSELAQKLIDIYNRVGDYPHTTLVPLLKPKKERVKNTATYLSVSDEEYVVTIKKSLAEEHGAPIDPWGEEMIPLSDES